MGKVSACFKNLVFIKSLYIFSLEAHICEVMHINPPSWNIVSYKYMYFMVTWGVAI